METHRIIELYQRWKSKTIAEDEQREFRWLLGDERAAHVLKTEWESEWESAASDRGAPASDERYEAIFEAIVRRPQQSQIRRWWSTRRVAAAVVLLLSIGMAVYIWSERAIPVSRLTEATDIAPGGNRATLTLADGRMLNLSSEQAGIVVGDEIIYYDDGSAVTAQATLHSPRSIHNSLTTPKGGTYQIILPDGSKVWLNANSTLKYPSRFSASARVVELEGEAYFEVRQQAKDAGQKSAGALREVPSVPFLVKTKNQTVEVLGTQFNVSAYTDNPETQTTLVEGAVRLSLAESGESMKLEPGEQASSTVSRIVKAKVDVEPYVAWKKGEFLFRNQPIEIIIRQLANWYAVDFEFKSEPINERFNAIISRDRPLSHVLRLLEETGAVQFKRKGDKIIVSP